MAYGISLARLIEVGSVATCAMVELELGFGARSGAEYETIRADRQLGYVWAPMGEPAFLRALAVQRRLAQLGRHRGVKLPDLLIAAAAERAELAVLHYDRDFELIAEVTGQPCEWVVPMGTVD
jgi:predicted nucleic acid-binding protein